MRGENKTRIMDQSWFQIVGTVLIFLLAFLLLWFNHAHSMQATSAVAAQVRFEGEYRIGDGPWQEIKEGKHIPTTKGDVTLRGNLQLYTPDGTEYIGVFGGDVPIAFYTDHINLTIYEDGNEPFVIDTENPLYGVSACAANWIAHSFSGDGTQPIEILVHNPHLFGNETAVDEMLANVSIWGTIDFERGIMESGKSQRNAGLLFVIVAISLLGSALFSALLHLWNNRIIWMLGLTIFFAGLYLVYSATGISFWSNSMTTNTTVLAFSRMLYMLFVSEILVFFLKGTKKIGVAATNALGVAVGICLALPMVTDIYLYDTLIGWICAQTVVNVVLMGCLMKEFISASFRKRCLYVGMALLPIAFELDVIGTWCGYWCGGVASKYVFFVLFAISMFVVLRIIPESINAAAKAKELEMQRSRLEAELKESRISIMLSQIQPHFIYNTLGTIERLCLKDPQKAFELVRSFSLYLRGNFSELDSVAPILFARELKHIEHYVNIEKVRFPDMSVEYDVKTADFVLPALSVQPLVENAIKHGLMRLESGGTVVIRSYETGTHFCVEVQDNGVGFDTSMPMDGKKHVGIRNIRGRLEAVVNGELILESEPGVGTKATILIPKEVIT